ncbi:hypothetical protein [Bdellovibrio sp. HCB337]|uniref:hypothetical protein n=1 Tax=Bdellovibrio sp. HCB337 TaxID=3394358 RepID=UPI0039A5463D
MDPNDRRSRFEVEQEYNRQEQAKKKELLTQSSLGVYSVPDSCQSFSAANLIFPYACTHEWVVTLQLQCKLTSDGAMPDFFVPLKYKNVEIDTDNASLKEETKQKFPVSMQTDSEGTLKFAFVSSGIHPFNLILKRNGIAVRLTEDMTKAPILMGFDFCGPKKQ